MSTTFDDLKANATVMAEYETTLLDGYTAEQLETLKYDAAKAKLQADASRVLNLRENDTSYTTTLNLYVDAYTSSWQAALMYCQLWLFFKDISGGDGSETALRMGEYRDMYYHAVNAFNRQSVSSRAFTNQINIVRG